MNVVIFGAGAVGGYFGGKLVKSNVSVTFLVREKRFQQLKERGLHVQSTYGNFSLAPVLASSVDEIQSPDVVILAVKNYHLESTLPQLRQLITKGAKILPLLNGVKHIKTLVDELGAEAVLGGSCYIEATLNDEGDVVHTSPMHDVVFGAIGKTDGNFLEKLRSAFEQAQINVKLSPTIMVDMWQKYLFLSTFSAITASTRKPIGDILSDSVTNDFLEQLVLEAVEVAKKHETSLPGDTFDAVMKRFHSISPQMTSSLHRDLEKGLPLELDSLQGGMIELGNDCEVSTPCMKAVYALLHPYRDGGALS